MCNPITSITTYCFSGKRRKIKYSNVLSEFEDIHGERVLEGNFNKKDVAMVKFPEFQVPMCTRICSRIFSTIIRWFFVVIVITHSVSYWVIRNNNLYSVESNGDIIVGNLNLSDIESSLNYFLQVISILFPLFFMNKISKFQESRKLYQALCGDVKAMAIYLCTLTDKKIKYHIVTKNNVKRVKSINKDAFLVYIKMRYILCVLPQVAKHVLRNDEKATAEHLDDKLRVQRKRMCCMWDKYIEAEEPWSKSKNNNLEKQLYKRIKDIKDNSGMDLFETCMTVLLDLIHEVSEDDLGFVGGVEECFVAKWENIYGSWGPLYTNNTKSSPLLVNLLFYLVFLAYTVVMPWSYLKYAPWTGYFAGVVITGFYSLMLWIGVTIKDPFQKRRCLYPVNPTISPDARSTQRQVYFLLKKIMRFDQDYIRGYGFPNQDKLFKNIMGRNGIDKIRPDRRRGIVRRGNTETKVTI